MQPAALPIPIKHHNDCVTYTISVTLVWSKWIDHAGLQTAVKVRYSIKFSWDLGFENIEKNAMEVCPLNKSDIRDLDYVVDSALNKIFDTNSKEIILECKLMCDLKGQRNFLLACRDLDNNLICRSIAAMSPI